MTVGSSDLPFSLQRPSALSTAAGRTTSLLGQQSTGAVGGDLVLDVGSGPVGPGVMSIGRSARVVVVAASSSSSTSLES